MSIKAIIFDFDGVIADSETIAHQALAEALTNIGLPTTLEEALAYYCGFRWSDCIEQIEARLGKPMPPSIPSYIERVTKGQGGSRLAPVAGALAFLERSRHLPRAIASSSPLSYLLSVCRDFGIAHHFDGQIFSADHLPHGKPHPQIYLNAADAIGVTPADCLVIEDSPLGVAAGVAAGMTVIGLGAASHIRAGHADRLRAAGAHNCVNAFEDIML